MKCAMKYKPLIWKTPPDDIPALREAYLAGDGLCPACKREGREVLIEERYGETP